MEVRDLICDIEKNDIQKVNSLYQKIISGKNILFSENSAEQERFMEMYRKCDIKKLIDLIVGEKKEEKLLFNSGFDWMSEKALGIQYSIKKEQERDGGAYTNPNHSVHGINIVEKNYQGTYDFGLNNSYQANAIKTLEELK